MNKCIFLPSVLLAVTACGEVVPLDDHLACPCASGWICCNDECVEGLSCPADGDAQASVDAQAICPGSIALGTQMVPSLGEQTVTGEAETMVSEGQSVSFDYAMSVWPKPYGWQLDGWLLRASPHQSFTFRAWAEADGDSVPLALVAYGPIHDVDTANCSGPMQSGGPMIGSEVQWIADDEGMYFVAPYHKVTEGSGGLTFQGLDDTAEYGHSHLAVSAGQ
jgi:hypothetical protein